MSGFKVWWPKPNLAYNWMDKNGFFPLKNTWATLNFFWGNTTLKTCQESVSSWSWYVAGGPFYWLPYYIGCHVPCPDGISVADHLPVRLAVGWWLVLVCSERRVLLTGGWFVLREKYCYLVGDKPSEQGAGPWLTRSPWHLWSCGLVRQRAELSSSQLSLAR
jgi:hypothetical protein